MTSELPAAVAQILTPDGRVAGTGFLVAEDVLVTCAHVVEAAGGGPGTTVLLAFPHVVGADRLEGTVPDELWRSAEDEDVAFIRLSGTPAGARVLPLGSAEGCRSHKVSSYGFPSQAHPEGHFGYAEAGDPLPATDDRGAHLQLTGANDLTTGFSGGPVLDEVTGLVIGMLTEIIAPDEWERGVGIAYAIPSEVLREILPELAEQEVCPYRGLEPFTVEHARWFQGRAEAVRQVVANLAQQRRLTLLLGPSGSGKSSLIQAGVLRTLAEGELPGSDRWLPVLTRPRKDMLAEIERAGLPGASEDGIIAAVNRRLAAEPSFGRVLLVIDQFEELLVQTTNGRLRNLLAVIDEVTSAADAYTKITVILIMRDDFYPQLAALAPKLLQAAMPGLLNVPGTLGWQDLHDIIVLPAEDVGLRFQPGLPERIIGDVLDITPGAAVTRQAAVTVLPLLEMTLQQLWNRRHDGYLTHEEYERIGEVSGSVTTWCDSALDELSPEQQDIARRALTSLVHPGDPSHNITAVRTQVPLHELRDLAADPGDGAERTDVDAVIAALARRRIITTQTLRAPGHAGAQPGEPVAELIHEALIRDWGALRKWVDQDHRFQDWLNRTRERQAHWADKKDPGDLLGGTALEEGIELSQQWRLPSDIAEFLTASKERHRASIRRSRMLIGVLSGLLVLALLAVGGVLWQGIRVGNAKERALSRELASQSSELIYTNPELSALLAVKAYRTSRTSEAMESLRNAGALPVHRRLSGHTREVRAVAYSPNGRTIASAGVDRYIRLWNTATWKTHAELAGHRKAVNAVAFSPDGRVLASAGADNTVRLWNPDTGAPGRVLEGHKEPVRALAFSPDGHTLASGSADSTVRLWDPSTGETRRTLTDHKLPVTSVAFSRDGKTLATADTYEATYLRDPVTGKQHTLLPDVALLIAFSPDSKTFATINDRYVRLWVAATGDDRSILRGHTSYVYSVAFSRDGRTVATAGADHSARLWDSATGRHLRKLTGHSDEVEAVALHPDGRIAATAGDDRTVRLWDTATGKLRTTHKEHRDWVRSVAFSGDGKTLATADDKGAVVLRNATTGKPRLEFAAHDEEVYGVAFSPDNRILATAGADSTVGLWDVASGEHRGTLAGHDAAVWSVAFSADGDTIATGSEDGTVRLWDADTRRPLDALTKHKTAVATVAFHPDEDILATGDAAGTVYLWDTATGEPRTALLGSFSRVTSAAFSPNGRTLATASDDGTARLWNINAIPEPEHALRQICRTFDRDLTKEERAAYTPGESDASVCS